MRLLPLPFTLEHLHCAAAAEQLSAPPPGRQLPIKPLIYGARRIPFQEAVSLKSERTKPVAAL